MEFKNLKKLFIPFVFVFLISFLIINWNEISWVFNYKVISRTLSDFFRKNSQEVISDSFLGNKTEARNFDYSNKENSLEIPKIGISAPLIFVSNEEEVYKSLDRGVVLFPNSVFPGEAGQTMILGHSSGPNWPKIKYDWVFSRLNELEEGDEILVYFNHQKYSYYMIKNFFLEKEEETPKGDLTNSHNMLLLITCWPPGKDLKRIVVEAALEI